MTPLCAFAVALAMQTAPVAQEPRPAPLLLDFDGEGEGRLPVQVKGDFGQGLSLETGTGSFGVNVRGRMQLRSEVAATPDEDDDDGERLEAAFLVRRLRLVIRGHALQEAVTFYMQLNFAVLDLEADLPVPLRDAYVTFHAAPPLNLRVGQMKVPFNRQRVTSSSALQFPDRSIVNNELNLDRDVGLQLYGSFLADRLTYSLGVFGGEGRNRVIPDSGVLAMGRLQVSPFGKFDDHSEGDLKRGDDLRLALGVAGGFNAGSRRERSTVGGFFDLENEDARVDYAHGVVDGILKWRGVSVVGEVIIRSAAKDPLFVPTRSAVGAFLQGGYMLTDQVEVVARAARVEPLSGDLLVAPTEVEPATELALGANAYIVGHDLKVQTDVIYGPDLAVPRLLWRVQVQLFF